MTKMPKSVQSRSELVDEIRLRNLLICKGIWFDGFWV
jgi:hypothetical protein